MRDAQTPSRATSAPSLTVTTGLTSSSRPLGYGHPIVYVAANSHAAYSHAGTYRALMDNAQGDGVWLLAPTVEQIDDSTPWVNWPGLWGDTGEGSSPRGPKFNDPASEWSDPDAWIGEIDDCDMGLTP